MWAKVNQIFVSATCTLVVVVSLQAWSASATTTPVASKLTLPVTITDQKGRVFFEFSAGPDGNPSWRMFGPNSKLKAQVVCLKDDVHLDLYADGPVPRVTLTAERDGGQLSMSTDLHTSLVELSGKVPGGSLTLSRRSNPVVMLDAHPTGGRLFLMKSGGSSLCDLGAKDHAGALTLYGNDYRYKRTLVVEEPKRPFSGPYLKPGAPNR